MGFAINGSLAVDVTECLDGKTSGQRRPVPLSSQAVRWSGEPHGPAARLRLHSASGCRFAGRTASSRPDLGSLRLFERIVLFLLFGLDEPVSHGAPGGLCAQAALSHVDEVSFCGGLGVLVGAQQVEVGCRGHGRSLPGEWRAASSGRPAIWPENRSRPYCRRFVSKARAGTNLQEGFPPGGSCLAEGSDGFELRSRRAAALVR